MKNTVLLFGNVQWWSIWKMAATPDVSTNSHASISENIHNILMYVSVLLSQSKQFFDCHCTIAKTFRSIFTLLSCTWYKAVLVGFEFVIDYSLGKHNSHYFFTTSLPPFGFQGLVLIWVHQTWPHHGRVFSIPIFNC